MKNQLDHIKFQNEKPIKPEKEEKGSFWQLNNSYNNKIRKIKLWISLLETSKDAN